ncbi:MAG: YaeQ family protein [Acidobacteria bacterium]|nr:YaeQ family protein [Acidobacteriota bacterium]
MLHDFQLAGKRMRLWQRPGESYEHVLMKALAYTMFAGSYPDLEIETRVGLRYKPDLIAYNEKGDFAFWGECGQNAIRKTHWILKHTRTEKMVLFKIAANVEQLVRQIRDEIPAKYRADGRLRLINFVREIVRLTETQQIEKVAEDWFTEHVI